MPLPVAHGLLGATVAEALRSPGRPRRWSLPLACALLGVCPDFDYALNWLRVSGGGWHHGFTHSLSFALLAGLTAAVAAGDRTARGVVIFGGATASHALLDLLITESRGVALWWPFTDRRYKLGLPNPIDYAWGSASAWEVAAGVLRVSLVELTIFAPLLLAVMWFRRSRAARAGGL